MSLIPIPYTSGMDQSNNTVLGLNCCQRLERARLVESGKLRISNGYYYYTYVSSTGFRTAFLSGLQSCFVSVVSGSYTVQKVKSSSSPVVSQNIGIDAFEAPIRVDVPIKTIDGTSFSSSSDPWFAVFGIPLSVQGYWAMLFRCSMNLLKNAYFVLMYYDEVVSTNIFPNIDSVGTAIDSVTGTSYFYVTDDATGHITVYKYTVSTGGYTAILNNPGGGGPLYNAGESACDLSVNTFSGTTYALIVRWTNKKIDVYNTGTNTYLWSIDISTAPGAPNSASICVFGDLVCVATENGYARIYRYTGAGGTPGSNWTNMVNVAGATSIAKGVLGQQTPGGKACAVWQYTSSSGVPRVRTLFNLSIVFNAGVDISGFTVCEFNHKHLHARPFFTVNNTSSWYVPVQGDAPILRSLELLKATDISAGLDVNVRASLLAAGELPVAAQLYQGGMTGQTLAPPQAFEGYVIDRTIGTPRAAIIQPFLSVASGVLTSAVCNMSASAALIGYDTDNSSVNRDCLQNTNTDSKSTLVSAGQPWLEGGVSCAAGYPVDGPNPIVSAGAVGGVFAAAAVYKYILVAEGRGPSQELLRSAPTASVAYTVPVGGLSSISVKFFWRQEAPISQSGIVRLFRTLANGYVFYDTGLSVPLNGVSDATPNASILDTVLDSNLQSNPILYSQGATEAGGLKPKYGIPPHRFAARGKDRLAIGGLEKSNRVRWSQTFFPGEGIAFSHATETGWFLDFPEPITALWALDDAWVVFSKNKVWLVFGAGPDDNGQNGNFDPPRLVSANVGAITWRSLAEIPLGLVFQSTDGQIYLLVRGQYQVQWISAPVKDELSGGLLFGGSPSGVLQNPIIASVVSQRESTIHFIRNLQVVAPPIVYDYRLNSWSLDGDGASTGLTGAIGGGIINVANGSGQQVPTVAIITPDNITAQSDTLHGSPSGSDWVALAETNDFAPFGFGGWGTVRRVNVIAEHTALAPPLIVITLWTNRIQLDGDYDQSVGLTTTESAVDAYRTYSIEPINAKCSAMRVRVEWLSASTFPSGLVFDVEATQKSELIPANRRA